MQLLAQKPAAEISLREVARAADVSHNAPYHHFSDRNGLLKALAERSMAELVDQVQDAVSSHPAPRAALEAGGAAYIRFAVDRPHAFAAIYDPAVCVPGEPTETMAPLIHALEGLLAGVAASAGLERADDVSALWGLAHGLGTLAAAGHLDLSAALDGYGAAVDRMLAAL